MNYEVLHEDEKMFHVKHPDGQTFTVAKNGLGKPLVEKIRGMYKSSYAEGGEVENQGNEDFVNSLFSSPTQNMSQEAKASTPLALPDVAAKEEAPRSPEDVLAGWKSNLGKAKDFLLGSPEDARKLQDSFNKVYGYESPSPVATPVALQQNAMPENNMATQGAAMPQGTPNLELTEPQQSRFMTKAAAQAPSIEQAIGLEMTGAREAAQAQAKAADAEAKILETAAIEQQARAKLFQEKMMNVDREIADQQKALLDKKVDPNRLWSQMSVGSKIGAALSVALGGLAQGLGKQNSNAALDVLNRMVDRDIEAQKADIEKGKNLLAQNMNRYQNLQAAEAATRLQQAAVVQTQLQQIAAKSKSPLVQANAKILQGQILERTAPLRFELAKYQMTQQMMQQNGMASADDGPARIRMLGQVGVMTPELQRKAFEEYTDLQKLSKFRDNVLSGFDKIAKLQSVENRFGSPVQSSKQIKAIVAPLNSELSKELAGKFTEFENENLDSVMPSLTDSADTVAVKRANLDKILSQKLKSSLLEAYGIPFPRGRFLNQGQTVIRESKPKL